MKTSYEKNGTELVYHITGVLDTAAAPVMEQELIPLLDEITSLRIDVSQMEYILSAGVRVIMRAAKEMMKKKGTVKVTGTNDKVKDIFRTLGLTRLVTME